MSRYICFTNLKHLIFWNGGSTIQDKEQLVKTHSRHHQPKKKHWKIEVLNMITQCVLVPLLRYISSHKNHWRLWWLLVHDKAGEGEPGRKPSQIVRKASSLDARNYARTRSLVDQRKPPLPCSHETSGWPHTPALIITSRRTTSVLQSRLHQN
jgi:hypothetical protein